MQSLKKIHAWAQMQVPLLAKVSNRINHTSIEIAINNKWGTS